MIERFILPSNHCFFANHHYRLELFGSWPVPNRGNREWHSYRSK